MHAMVLNAIGAPLVWTELPDRQPGPGQIRVKVGACGVCRTDLHVIDGELAHPHVPIIPGHEIVGRIEAVGADVDDHRLGERVGIPWLGHTCGTCPYCRSARENLCDDPQFTGYTRDGGYATSVIADARFAFALGEHGDDVSLAPLLCAGLIGWRSLVMAGEARRIGLYGFGAAAHIIAQVARWQGRSVFAFTSQGDKATQDFAQGRARCLRRHPYERHTELPLCAALGRASASIRCQPDASGRYRFPRPCSRDWHRHADEVLSAAGGQPGARRPARWPLRRSGRARSMTRSRREVLMQAERLSALEKATSALAPGGPLPRRL